jgi:HlyD family secretion protein
MSALFRQQAEASANSPEGLEMPLKVVGRSEWIGLIGAGIIILAAVLWGFLGTVETTVTGKGILLRQAGGTLAVTAPEKATVTALLVEPGAEVKQGQVLARLHLLDGQERVTSAEQKLNALRKQRKELASYWDKYLKEQQASLNLERSATRQALDNAEAALKAARTEFKGVKKLKSEALTTDANFDRLQQNYYNAINHRDDLRIKMQGLDARRLALVNQRDQALNTIDLSIIEANGNLASARKMLDAGSTIVAPKSGRVTALAANTGDNLNADDQLLTISYGDPALSAVIYVPASSVEWLRLGARVHVTPGTVHPEEYGTVLGTVATVAGYPVTKRAMRRRLNNDTLADDLLRDGPLLAVNINLARDADTPSKLKWSSGRGPNTQIHEGTLASAGIVIHERSPASLIIPALRRFLGIRALSGKVGTGFPLAKARIQRTSAQAG